MGQWGLSLFDNDTSLDIKEMYKKLLEDGKLPDEITSELIEIFNDTITDYDEGPLFWITLAELQWRYGRVTEGIIEKGLESIDTYQSILSKWISNSESSYERQNLKRYKVKFEKVREKLTLPPPPEKKISKPRLYRCPWSIGDVFAFELESDLAKEHGLLGKFFVLQKVTEKSFAPGHTIPIVRVRLADKVSLPYSSDEVRRLELVTIGPPGLLKNNPRIPEYYLALESTSKRSIPKKLIFLGNFPVENPDVELIRKDLTFLFGVYWKFFEEVALKRYLFFNREINVYPY